MSMQKYNVFFPAGQASRIWMKLPWTMPMVASMYISSPVYFWPHGSSSTCHIIFNTRPEGQRPSRRFQSRWSSSKTNHVDEIYHFDSAPREEKAGLGPGFEPARCDLIPGFHHAPRAVRTAPCEPETSSSANSPKKPKPTPKR